MPVKKGNKFFFSIVEFTFYEGLDRWDVRCVKQKNGTWYWFVFWNYQLKTPEGIQEQRLRQFQNVSRARLMLKAYLLLQKRKKALAEKEASA